MAFLFGIPKKLIQRIKEIEIDTHYYDKDVVPSAQEIFTYDVNKKKEIATITGLVNSNTITAVIPYQIHYDQTSRELIAKVTELSENCFSKNNALKQITIPNTIHIIPSNCFKNCLALETVNIPTSVHTIKSNAFNNCDKLSSVFIPYGVNTIETGAFLDCENLKIICYKHSTAETYAVNNNIPYSLISYTLDDDIAKNSPNLVTSGVIWNHIQNILKKIIDHSNDKDNSHNVTKTQVGLSNVDNTSDLDKPLSTASINEFKKVNDSINTHIDNKTNPHDDSTFNNSKLIGNTTINSGTVSNIDESNNNAIVNVEYVKRLISDGDVGNLDSNLSEAYQKRYDAKLNTDNKTVVGAINELSGNVHSLSGKLTSGWNTINLNKLYPISWKFLNKPFCYTDDGIAVDYRITELSLIENNTNAFKIYVPLDCNYALSTTRSDEISGVPVDYLLLKYYYTGQDGKDLDTVTALSNNWNLTRKTIGYGHQPDSPIKNNNNIKLIQFSGDNRGGDTGNANDIYYEYVYFDIKHIQDELPNEDVEIILYAAWYEKVSNGHINVSLECYSSDEIPTVNDLGDVLSLSVNGVTLTPTYVNNSTMELNINSYLNRNSGAYSNYVNTYTPAFKITFHKVISESNHRTITVQQLS